MKYFQIKKMFLLVLLCIWPQSSVTASDVLPVFVSIIPQKYFVEKIGGDFVNVFVMVEPGAGPATYEPKPRQMTDLNKAELYFAIGVPFENVWLKKISAGNPNMQIIYTQEGIEKLPMASHSHDREAETHEEEKGHFEKDHRIKDPHIWLSPPLVMIQARNILTALIDAAPVHKSIFEKNYKAFINELIDLDIEMRNMFAEKRKSSEFMVFHPSWGYFARAYGLKQIPVELEGKTPKPAHLQELINQAREKKINIIFVQPQFSSKSAEVIARAISGRVISLDSLALNWAENLRNAGLQLKNSLQ